MRIFLTIILGYFILPLNAQYFEGNIRYEYSFINEKGVDITDSLGLILGTYQDYYVNESNYKSFMDGPISFQLYNSESNTYYMKYSDGRAYKLDAAKKFSEITKISHVDTLVQILGHNCKGVTIETDKGRTTYFYNENIKVNPANFEQHNFGNWNAYLRAMNGALTLKFISEEDGYVWESTAKELKKYNIPDKEFKPSSKSNR